VGIIEIKREYEGERELLLSLHTPLAACTLTS
jgi:hypothetical protein